MQKLSLLYIVKLLHDLIHNFVNPWIKSGFSWELGMLCLKRSKSDVYLFICFHLNSLLEKMADREENNFADEEKVINFPLIWFHICFKVLLDIFYQKT